MARFETEAPVSLNLQELQAILNALRDAGALDGPLVFDHVMRLERKVIDAMASLASTAK